MSHSMCSVHFRAFLWREWCFLFFSFAAVVLWSTATRTLPFWRRTAKTPGLLTVFATDRQSIQSDILQALVEIETGCNTILSRLNIDLYQAALRHGNPSLEVHAGNIVRDGNCWSSCASNGYRRWHCCHVPEGYRTV
ncbi:hypothetical protein BJ741DRAFT_432223 [Chytriomyces cf. hyalinus JEL632]|nr:hypothetical protein BJ741DRAFT_432223 [Chytriomyces cf. hyalinus JEL632]